MGLFSWGKDKTRKASIGLIAIGSGGLEVAVVASGGQIIFSAGKDYIKTAGDNVAKFSSTISQTLNNVLSELQKSPIAKPIEYHCVLPAPLFLNTIRELEIKKNQPFIIEQKMIDHLLAESVVNFMAEKEIVSSGLVDDKNRLIENDIYQTELNGYRQTNILGQKVKELKLLQGLSYGSDQILKSFEEMIVATTHAKKIHFHTFPSTIFKAVDALIGAERDDYLVIDAGGEFTDIVVVHDRAPVTHFSFPYGLNSLGRNLAEQTKTSPTEAISTLKLYFQNKLTNEARDSFQKVLAGERQKWLDYFNKAFSAIAEETFIFPQVYLLGDDLSVFFVRDFLNDPSLRQLVLNKNEFHLSTIDSHLKSSSKKITMFNGRSSFIDLVAPIFSPLN